MECTYYKLLYGCDVDFGKRGNVKIEATECVNKKDVED